MASEQADQVSVAQQAGAQAVAQLALGCAHGCRQQRRLEALHGICWWRQPALAAAQGRRGPGRSRSRSSAPAAHSQLASSAFVSAQKKALHEVSVSTSSAAGPFWVSYAWSAQSQWPSVHVPARVALAVPSAFRHEMPQAPGGGW